VRKADLIKANNKVVEIIEEGEDGFVGIIRLRSIEANVLFVFSFGGGWEHVSVSTNKRCLTWDEMCIIKDIFFRDDELVVQYHPPKTEYKNLHPYSLHLWRPKNEYLPAPPVGFV